MNQSTGLNYINIGGKSRPVHFGLNQTAVYCQVRKCDMKRYMDDLALIVNGQSDGSQIRDLYFSALVAGHMEEILTKNPRASDETLEFPFSRFVIGTWVDKADRAETNKVFEIMATQNSPNVDGATSEPKKTAAQAA